jgi:CBS domain-containing protein
MVAFGMLELIVGADLGGIWTIVIGLFLTGAAAAERESELARDTLGGLTVRDVMVPEPVRVPAGITVDLFSDSVLAGGGQTAALVVEAGDEVLGVAGLAEASGLRGGRRREARVRDITVPLASVPVAGPDEPVLEAFERAAASMPAARGAAGAYLLVVDDGAIVGIVSSGDLARRVAAREAAASQGPAAKPAAEGPAP